MGRLQVQNCGIGKYANTPNMLFFSMLTRGPPRKGDPFSYLQHGIKICNSSDHGIGRHSNHWRELTNRESIGPLIVDYHQALTRACKPSRTFTVTFADGCLWIVVRRFQSYTSTVGCCSKCPENLTTNNNANDNNNNTHKTTKRQSTGFRSRCPASGAKSITISKCRHR